MTKEQILQAFEGRWRIKKEYLPLDSLKYEGIAERIKDLCLDFFRTGILLAEQSTVPEGSPEGKCEVQTSQILPDGTGTPFEEVDPFEYWWKLYDLKVGRDKCEKKWAKLTEKEKSECIAATPAYVASTPDKQFRKRPLTYLNGKCWNDEIIPHNNGTNKPTIEQQRIDKLADILTK